MNDESLFERYKNEVRTKLSVRDLVEEAKPKGLRATGASSLICCSPLRADKNPSFSVFKNGGDEYIGFDHATRESFDLYGYIEKKEGLSFAEAVKWAGDRVGMSWDDYKKQNGEGSYAAPPPPGISQAEWDRARDGVLALDERQLVGNVQQAMVDLAHAMFLRSGLPAYVEKRWGISPETQNRFMLGFIPHGFASLLDQLYEQGDFKYGRRKLVKTGWFVERSQVAGDPNPELRCIFDGRLLYPYLFRGKCRYAAARIIYEQDIDPSYFVGARVGIKSKFKKAMVNSSSRPSVSPYVQNDILYNADNLLRSRSGFKRIVIVEGPSDCMTMVEQGYDCVAPVTTSVRDADIPALVQGVEKYEEVVLATDTDIKDGRRPGLEGALRMAPALMVAGKKVRLLILPLDKGQTKMDPAAWVVQWKEQGKTGDPFERLMKELPNVARGLVNFLDPEITAEKLPEALTDITKFALLAKLSKPEMKDVARDVSRRLAGGYSRTDILTAMGVVTERIAKEDRIVDDDEKTIRLEGAVTERGGFDQSDVPCGYETWSKTGGANIADFILQPRRTLVIGSETVMEVSVYKGMSQKILDRWVIPNQAWVTRRDFKSALMKATDRSFTGSDDNVQGIRKLVSDRATALSVSRVRGESMIGLHSTSNGLRLVLQGETWDVNGPMENPDVVYLSDHPLPPISGTIQVDGTQEPSDVDSLVKRSIELIFTLNDPVKITTICSWVLGCYFTPQVRELNGGKVSILNVFGSPGSGKTTLMQKAINRTLLPFSSKFEPARPAQTLLTTMEMLSWANIFCAPFDEYRTSEARAAFDGLLRTGFSGGSEARGRPGMASRLYQFVGAAQVTGEQRFSVDQAMKERLIMVSLDRTAIARRDTSGLYELLSMTDRWRVATDILQWRLRLDQDQIAQWWEQAREGAATTIEQMDVKDVVLRALDTCIEMAFYLRILKEWFVWRGAARVIDVKLASLEQVWRMVAETRNERPLANGDSLSVGSLVASALEKASDYAVSGAFEEKRGWRICLRGERKMLVVHPGVMAAVVAREEHVRGRPDPTNGLSALRQSAREEYERGGDLGWFVDPSFPYRMGSSDEIGGDDTPVRSRCWLIDIVKAYEQAGLSLDWPGEIATWGGHKRKPPPGTVGLWKQTTARAISGSGGGVDVEE